MKHGFTRAMLFFTCLAVAGVAMAQSTQPAPKQGAASRPAASQPAKRPGAGRPSDEKFLLDRIADLNLSEEQKAQVKQILEAQRQAVNDWQRENNRKVRELENQLKEANKAGDTEAAKAAGDGLKSINESRRTLHENMIKQLTEALTPEQMERVRAMLASRVVRNMPGLQSLSLTEEQKQQVRRIFEDARNVAEATKTKEAKDAIWAEAFEKVKATVLTDPQRKMLDDMQRHGDFFQVVQKLKLTDEQKAKIAEIRKTTETQVAQAKTQQEKRQFVQAALKKINTEVLTDAQRAQLKKEKATSRPARAARRATSSSSAPATQPA